MSAEVIGHRTRLSKRTTRRVDRMARDVLPWLRGKEPGESDKDLLTRHRLGLETALVTMNGHAPAERSRALIPLREWGDRSDVLHAQAAEISRETEANRQRSVEALYGMTLLKEFNKDAQTLLPWLREKEPGAKDEHLVARHVRGLLDAYDVSVLDDTTDQGEKEKAIKEKQLDDWGERKSVLQGRLKVIDLDKKREEITEKAKQWNDGDMARVMRETHVFVKTLPETQRQDLYERANLTPETMIQTFKRWGITLGANAVSVGVPLEAAIVGGAVAGATPLEKVGTAPLLAAIAITYGFWFSGLWRAAKASNDLLEEQGIATKWQAKALYDWMSRYTESRKLRRAAGAIGYIGPQLIAEIPWVAAALAAVAAGLPVNEMLSTFTGINVGGAAGEEINARATRKLKDRMN